MVSGPMPQGSPGVMAMGKKGCWLMDSGRVVDVDEFVRQAQLGGHVRRHRRCAIALGRVVAASQKSHPGFLGQVRLGLRDFSGDEGVHPGGNRGFKVALGSACAPAHASDGPAIARSTLESQLRPAFDLGELAIHYQPEIDLATGAVLATLAAALSGGSEDKVTNTGSAPAITP